MLNKLLNVKTSCHHGDINYENQLEAAKKLKNYDMIEIDFIYNGQHISSHDYDEVNISKGNTLKEWIEFIIKENKILWIDLKDDHISIFLPQLSKLNIIELINELNEYKLLWQNLEEYILIGCQYHTIYEELINLNSCYTIIKDLPKDKFYVMDILTPDFLTPHTKTLMIPEIALDIGNAKILAIDQHFFTLESLQLFINNCNAEIIIIYTCHSLINIETNKHIIYQYDFKYPFL